LTNNKSTDKIKNLLPTSFRQLRLILEASLLNDSLVLGVSRAEAELKASTILAHNL